MYDFWVPFGESQIKLYHHTVGERRKVHLLTLLLAFPYDFARRQTRCLHSLLEVSAINRIFLGRSAPLLGTLVWGQVAEEGWQGWKRAWIIV